MEGQGAAALSACAAALIAWFRENARDLPWRRGYDPYRTLVSEFMLQQTQVGTVIPYFERWMARWPDLAALAAADEAEALKLWEGLGYYSRCRNLLKAARAMAAAGYAQPPASAEALRDFPGIGEYTAGAVASVGYDLPVPAVDGNVERVLSRLLALTEQGEALRREASRVAAAMLEGVSPRELNQAFMDLGATVCTPRGAACGLCPWEKDCLAHREGRETAFPVPKPRAPVSQDNAWGLLAFQGPSLLLRRRPERGLWASLWELPWFPRAGEFRDDLKKGIPLPLQLAEGSLLEVGAVDFSYTTHRVRAWVVACDIRPDGALPEGWGFFSRDALEALTLPAPSRKFLAAFRGIAAPLLEPGLHSLQHD